MGDFRNILNDERYKDRIEKLKDKDLKIIVDNELKALGLARKGIAEIEPEKVNNLEYLNIVAHGMQKLAKIVLKSRNNVVH